MKTYLAALLLFFFGLTSSYGQELKGVLIDIATGEPLEYATAAVYHQETDTLVTGVVTDKAGSFIISNIPEGTYILEVSFIGYAKQTINDLIIHTNQSSIDLGILGLTIGTNQLNEVVVLTESATVINKIDRQD